VSNKINITNKYEMLSNEKPMGIDLTDINPIKLFDEVQSNTALSVKLNRFGQIFRSLEGLKQFNVPFYNENAEKLLSFRDAVFYNELVQIQVFFEFIKGIDTPNEEFPYLKKIIENKNNVRLNKIRNAISHFDWIFENGNIIFRDKNFEKRVSYREVSSFSSLVSIIAVFMTNNIDKID